MTEPAFEDFIRAPRGELPGDVHSWVEDSLRLLTDRFGTDPLRRTVVVPEEFVPAGYDGSETAAHELCQKVAERMGIPSDRIRFSFRLDEVLTAGQVMGAALIVEYAKGDSSVLPSASPEDIEAIRDHSTLFRGLTGDGIERALAGAGEDLLPEVQRFAFLEFLTELVRCREIAAEPDPERRAALAQESDRPDPDAIRESTVAGKWIDLTHCLPGIELLPGYSAVMFHAGMIADPAVLMAVASHELGHEVLRPSTLDDIDEALREPLTDLYAVFHGFGIAHANVALDETTIDQERVQTFGYLGERAATDALASYRFHQHRLTGDDPLVPAWHEALDPVPRARFLARLRELEALGN